MEENGADQHPTESQERYADELAGPDDYWLTLTDAARATRRQEVSIRRWISKGLLPVRRQHVGLNQRTRLVRASDLAALTPIIDPAGAITTERSRLDLTSIPAQQAQIKASQQTLLTQLDQLQHQLHAEAQTREQLLAQQWTSCQEIIATLRRDMLTSNIQQQDALAQQRKEVDITITQQRVALEHTIDALAVQHKTTFTQLTQNVVAVAERLETLARLWQESTQQQQQCIDGLVESLQQEHQTQNALIEQVQELTARLAEQQARHEREVRVREQLVWQIGQLTSQIAEQQTKRERETQAREQLALQVTELVEQHIRQRIEQEQAQQQLAATSIQQQEQLAALRQSCDTQRQSYENLSQEYVGLQVHMKVQELALGELQQRMVRYQALLQDLTSPAASDSSTDNSLNQRAG